GRRRLDDAAGGIAYYHLRLFESGEIERLSERGDEHRTTELLAHELLQPLVDRPPARVRICARENQRSLGKALKRRKQLLHSDHGIDIAKRGRMVGNQEEWPIGIDPNVAGERGPIREIHPDEIIEPKRADGENMLRRFAH